MVDRFKYLQEGVLGIFSSPYAQLTGPKLRCDWVVLFPSFVWRLPNVTSSSIWCVIHWRLWPLSQSVSVVVAGCRAAGGQTLLLGNGRGSSLNFPIGTVPGER